MRKIIFLVVLIFFNTSAWSQRGIKMTYVYNGRQMTSNVGYTDVDAQFVFTLEQDDLGRWYVVSYISYFLNGKWEPYQKADAVYLGNNRMSGWRKYLEEVVESRIATPWRAEMGGGIMIFKPVLLDGYRYWWDGDAINFLVEIYAPFQ